MKLSARFEKLGLEAPSRVNVDSDNRTFKAPYSPLVQKETPGDPGEKQGDYLSFKIINQKQKVIHDFVLINIFDNVHRLHLQVFIPGTCLEGNRGISGACLQAQGVF